MAQSHRRLAPEGDDIARRDRHRLDELDANRVGRNLVMFEPDDSVLADVVAKARLSIPGLAPTEEAIKVQHHNSICIMALARKSRFDAAKPIAEGFIAILPLTSLGLQMLALGAFDASTPDLRLITKPGEKPAGIYMWGVYGPGPLAAGMALFMEKMTVQPFIGVDLYSRPNTDVGIRFNHVLGFTRGTVIEGIDAPNIWKFSRTPEPPAYDSYVPHSGTKEIGITVARTFDDLLRIAAIRNAVYIGEQECPYEEEYDGNDLSALHLLAYIGDEPVGCLRLRFFADYVKFERVAVRKEFRTSRAAIRLIQAGLKLCQKKGYRRVMGHAQSRLAPFWTRFGFRPMEGRPNFVFSDYDYVEMVAELEPDPEAINLNSDPYVAIRPEGRWHTPGILERSASRAASSPSVAKKH